HQILILHLKNRLPIEIKWINFHRRGLLNPPNTVFSMLSRHVLQPYYVRETALLLDGKYCNQLLELTALLEYTRKPNLCEYHFEKTLIS
ncbi:hypothetical protein MXB_1350, partial [Myxobolus squamalis]